MFRKEVKTRILDVVKDSPLTEHAFHVDFGGGDGVILHIHYVLNNQFYFGVTQSSENKVFEIRRAPGNELLTEETHFANSVDNLIHQVQRWLQAVESEDEVGSESDNDLDKLKQTFFRDLARHVKDESRHFTQEEANDILERIEKLEQQMEHVLTSQKKSTSEIQSVKKLFKEAKKDTGTMTKKKWLVVGGGKIFNALLSIATSKEGRKVVADSVRGLLEHKNP